MPLSVSYLFAKQGKGLEVEALYGDRDGGLYTRRCRRVSVVGRKDD